MTLKTLLLSTWIGKMATGENPDGLTPYDSPEGMHALFRLSSYLHKAHSHVGPQTLLAAIQDPARFGDPVAEISADMLLPPVEAWYHDGQSWQSCLTNWCDAVNTIFRDVKRDNSSLPLPTRRMSRSFSQWGTEEFATGYPHPHSVWLFIVGETWHWEQLIASSSFQPLLRLICIRWELSCRRGRTGMNVLVGLCTPVSYGWINTTLGSQCSCRFTPLRASMAVVRAISSQYSIVGAISHVITHHPAVFPGFSQYARTYGCGYVIEPDWEDRSLLNGDPPWVFRRLVGKIAFERYQHEYLKRTRDGWPYINRIHPCRYIPTECDPHSIIELTEYRHGRGSCAGFSLDPDCVQVRLDSWGGEPVGIVDCTYAVTPMEVLQATLAQSGSAVHYGCIVLFLYMGDGGGRRMSTEEFNEYYPATPQESWVKEVLAS